LGSFSSHVQQPRKKRGHGFTVQFLGFARNAVRPNLSLSLPFAASRFLIACFEIFALQGSLSVFIVYYPTTNQRFAKFPDRKNITTAEA
jgi:hypothetical protein